MKKYNLKEISEFKFKLVLMKIDEWSKEKTLINNIITKRVNENEKINFKIFYNTLYYDKKNIELIIEDDSIILYTLNLRNEKVYHKYYSIHNIHRINHRIINEINIKL